MIKTLGLLAPLYITIFWFLLLNNDKKTHAKPRAFITKLMFLFVILNLSRFLMYQPLPDIYVYIDVFYLFVGLLGYPLYHIYFRLLTVDEDFSFKKHYVYLIIPVVVELIYLSVYFTIPFDIYKEWLFDKSTHTELPQIRLIYHLRLLVIIVVDIQAVYYLVVNTVLLNKYKDRAEQFYSNIEDGKYNNAKMLNYLLIFNCLIHVANALGIVGKPYDITLYSVLYAIDYYMIGYMGLKQKAINPTFETISESLKNQKIESGNNYDEKIILTKLKKEFEVNKIHLNTELTILDLIKLIGTNRTYLSTLINQEFNQNFCSLVNGYRVRELEQVIIGNKDAIHESLAEKAGFGSVNSMKRAVQSKTGLAFSEWKKSIIAS